MNEIVPQTNIIVDLKKIINDGRQQAYAAANRIAVQTYWNIGKRIVEEEQGGASRAQYGEKLIDFLSQELTIEYGSGFSSRSLRTYRQFYLSFKDLEIWSTRVPNLGLPPVRRRLEPTPNGVNCVNFLCWQIDDRIGCRLADFSKS